VIERAGLARISDYVGRDPVVKTHAELAARLPAAMPGFVVSPDRWLEEALLHYRAVDGRLRITYDPALRDSFLKAFEGPSVDAWPLFEACAGLPLGLIRGANSDLLSMETVAEMRARRPDMIFGQVPDRAHIPFLDEADSLAVIRAFIGACA
jgi:hypothetical protein